MRFWFPATLLGLCAAAPVWAGGPAHLVADLNPATVPWDETFTPVFKSFTPLGGRVLFLSFLFAGDDQCGLWSTDGTAAGTGRLADLCAESLSPDSSFRVQILGVAGPLAFLTDSLGRLWRTDGTAAGAGTFPLGATVARDSAQPVVGPGGILYFVACDTARVCQPWRSDGTAAGTGLLRAIETDPDSPPFFQFVVQGHHVVFSSTDPQGAALWTTDGTPDGTRELAVFRDRIGAMLPVGDALYVSTGNGDVWLAPEDGSPLTHAGSFPLDFRSRGVGLLQAGGRVLIEDDEGDGVVSLWEIPAPHRRVRLLARFENGMGPISEVGGRLVFAAGGDGNGNSWSLWGLGPRMVHPKPLRDCPGGCPRIDPFPPRLSVLGGRAVFAGRDHRGSELWETDGTGAGTRFLKDLCPGKCGSLPRGFSPALGRLLFTAGDRDLWVTDGTAAGTARLGRILTGVADGLDFAVLGRGVVFNGLDSFAGSQPWASDLTVAGTRRILTFGGGLEAGSSIQSLTPFGSGVLFGACSAAGGTGLWRSDGSAGGTERLLDAGQGCASLAVSPIVTAGGATFFSLDPSHLWRTDGTPEGTQVLAAWSGSDLGGLLPLNGALFFSTSSPQPPFGSDFWRSDGTPQGTVQTGSVTLGGGLYMVGATAGSAFFVAQHSEPPFDTFLWRTDGTSAGTAALVDLVSPPGFLPGDFVLLDGKALLVMQGVGRPAERELWTSDGSAAGTAPVFAATAGANALRPLNPRQLTAFQGAAYFFADTGEPARPLSLWRSDGTAAGTSLVTDFAAPGDPSALFSLALTPAGDFLFFALDDGVHGQELWRTDGTAAGTVLVRDIAPGAAHSRPQSLAAGGDRLYFTATDGEHGLELWTSDGTAAGTAMVQDVLPGPASSWPRDLVATDGNLFFTAVDAEHGRELWVLPLGASP